jgi:Arc/MetJ family transcription regulator
LELGIVDANLPTRNTPRPLYTFFYTLKCVVYYTSGGTVPTNLAIDDRLLAEAQKAGRHKTKRETVNAALKEYVQRRKQQKILSIFGSLDYEPGYDYKRERTSRRS